MCPGVGSTLTSGWHLRLAVAIDVRRAGKSTDSRTVKPYFVRASASSRRCSVDRDAREEPVAAAVVEVEVRVDDDRDAPHELVRERVRVPLLAVVFDRRRRVDRPRVDEDEPVGMLDRV